MNDPGFVGSLERRRELARQRESFGDANGPAAQTLGQRVPLDQFENERMDALAPFQPIDRADVGVIERRQHPRLVLEPGEPFGIGPEGRWQDLDGDVAPELGVPRPVCPCRLRRSAPRWRTGPHARPPGAIRY
jgi:hypothetical protein